MAVIKIKRSQTVGVPTRLASGELAYSALPNNGTNGGDTLYIGFGPETQGNAQQKIPIGGKLYTDAINQATSALVNNTLIRRDSSGNFAANQITASLIGNAATSTKWANPVSITVTGDISGSIPSIDGSQNLSTNFSLIDTGVVAGVYGSSNTVPVVTVDAKGRVTQVTTVAAADQLTPTGVAAGSYGAGTFVPVVTVNSQGRVTRVEETPIIFPSTATAWANSVDVTFSGDVSGTISNLDGTTDINAQLTLANTTVVPGTYGTTSQIPVISVDNKGRVTNISTIQVANADGSSRWTTPRNISLIGDVTGNIVGLDGSQNITTSVSLATTGVTAGTYGSATQVPSFTVDSKGRITSVSTTNIQAGSSLELFGNIGSGTASGSLQIIGTGAVSTTISNNNRVTISVNLPQQLNTNSNVTFSNLTLTGGLTVGGDLTVNGSVTTVNSTTLAIADKNIELAKNASSTAQADGAGITILGPQIPATLTYSGTFDRWALNKDLVVPLVIGNLQGNASTANKWTTPISLTLFGDVSGFIESLDGSNISVSTRLTLPTVNTSPGVWGSGYAVPVVTVNLKGQVTSVSQTNIPLATSSSNGLASFNSASFTVNSGAVSLSEVDCGTY